MSDESFPRNTPPPPPPPKSTIGSLHKKKNLNDSSRKFFPRTDPGVSPIFRADPEVETSSANQSAMKKIQKKVPRRSSAARDPLAELSPIFPNCLQNDSALGTGTENTWQRDQEHLEWISQDSSGQGPSTEPNSSCRVHPTSGYQHKAHQISSLSRGSSSRKEEKKASEEVKEGLRDPQNAIKDYLTEKERGTNSKLIQKHTDVVPLPGVHSFDNSEKLPCLPPIKRIESPKEGCDRMDLLGRHQNYSPVRWQAKPSDRSPMAEDEKRLLRTLRGPEKDLEDMSRLGKFVPMDPLTSQGSPNTRSTLPTKFGEGITPCLKTAERSDPTSVSIRSPGEDTLLFQGIRPPEIRQKSFSMRRSEQASKQREVSDEQNMGFVDEDGESYVTQHSSAVERTSHSFYGSEPHHSSINQHKTVPVNKSLEKLTESSLLPGHHDSPIQKRISIQKTAEFSWEGRHTPFVYDCKGGTSKKSPYQNTKSQFRQLGDSPSKNVSSPFYRFDSQDFGTESRSSPMYQFDSGECRSVSHSSPMYNFDSKENCLHSQSSPLYTFDSADCATMGSFNYYSGADKYQSTQNQGFIPHSGRPGASTHGAMRPTYARDERIPTKSRMESFYREVLDRSPSPIPPRQQTSKEVVPRNVHSERAPVAEPLPAFNIGFTDAELDQVRNQPSFKLDRLLTLYIEDAIRRRGLGRMNLINSPTPLTQSLDKHWYKYREDCRTASIIFELSKEALVHFEERERYWENKRRSHGVPVDWIVRHYFLCRKNMNDEPTLVSDASFLRRLPVADYRDAEREYLKFIYIMQH